MQEEYPVTLEEFERKFCTEESCKEYLFSLRWPSGYICPRCGNKKAWPIRGSMYECSKCHYQISVTAGTIFQDTRKPLTMWFRAIWWITAQKNGASALSIQKILGLRSYETAWTWLHKLRAAMVRPSREKLSGHVEVDETYWGSEKPGKRGRGAENKMLIAVAVEVKDNRLGRVRLKRINDTSALSLLGFISASVEKGSTINTDGLPSYHGLKSHGYIHEVTIIRNLDEASEPLPNVHLVIMLLKRWILGTHQGAIREKHLDYYLDEFTFRFNRRTSRYRGKLFYRLLENAVMIEPTTYDMLISRALE